jgi:hypothetical protein
MSKLYDKDHAPTVAQALRIAALRLGPHANLAGVRERLAAAHGSLDLALDEAEAADDAVVAQSMQIAYEDRIIDRLVAVVAREKRATIPTAQPDRHPSFRELFPGAPSTAMRGTADTGQSTYVAAVLEGLGRPENADLAARHADALRLQQAKVEEAVARRDQLEKAAALKRLAVERAVVAARQAFNDGQLDVASITHDEALVASLFDFRTRRGGADPDPNVN